LNLLKDIQESRNLSMIFVSHDMAVVEFMSDQVAVLYNGKIMENGSAEDVFANPKSAYTRTLLDSSPSL
jgi:ABC-type oligopeptide transport system ATPase subunit